MEVFVGLSKGLCGAWRREWVLALLLCGLGAFGLGAAVALPPLFQSVGWFAEVDYSFRGDIAVNLTVSEPVFSQALGRCSVVVIYLVSPNRPQQAPVTIVVRNATGGSIAMLTNRTSWQFLPPGMSTLPRAALFEVLPGEYTLEIRRETADTYFGCYAEAYSVSTNLERVRWTLIGDLLVLLLSVFGLALGVWLAMRAKARIEYVQSPDCILPG